MTPEKLDALEAWWRDEENRPGGTTAQEHVLDLIKAVRQRDTDIMFLLDALQLPAVGLYENRKTPGEWYLLYNTRRGGIEKTDLPDTLRRVMSNQKESDER
jgi:hypothetical protein